MAKLVMKNMFNGEEVVLPMPEFEAKRVRTGDLKFGTFAYVRDEPFPEEDAWLIDNHRAHPGPYYWDWRCMICDHPVSEHSFWRWLYRRIFGKQRYHR
jgi:hypothetical protein